MFEPAPDRDPVGLLLAQADTRVPELVPIRHGRMLVSPFTFFRGRPLPMAADLAGTPTSGCGSSCAGMPTWPTSAVRLTRSPAGLRCQRLRRDASRPLRVGRQASGREPGRSPDATTTSTEQDCASVLAGVRSYRTAMREFARMPLLDVWYAHLDVEEAVDKLESQLAKRGRKLTEKAMAKARTRDSLQALGKLTTVVDGQRRITSDPPLIVPVEELFTDTERRRALCPAQRPPGRVRAHPPVGPPAPDAAVHAGPRGPQGGRRRECRHPCLDPAARAGTTRNRCSSRPRRPRPRCWPTTAARAGTTTKGNG